MSSRERRERRDEIPTTNIPLPESAPPQLSLRLDMVQRSELGALLSEKYRLLEHLESTGKYGYQYIEQFIEALVDQVDETGSGVVQVIGESLSGKSHVASQIGALMQDVGITPIYLPWGDVIRDAKRPEVGIVAEERPFGRLSPQEFSETSRLYYTIAQHLLTRDRDPGERICVIGEAIALPGMYLAEDGTPVPLDRATTATRDLIKDHHAFVLGLYGSGRVRRLGREFRRRLATVSDAEVAALVDEFGMVVPNLDPVSLKLSGAPVDAVEEIEDQISQTLLYLADRNVLAIPKKRRTLEYLQEHRGYRSHLVGEQLLPRLLVAESELYTPEDRAFIGFNKRARFKIRRFDLDSIHYSRTVDAADLVSSSAA